MLLFTCYFLGFNRVSLTSDGHAQDGILDLKLLNESRGFSLLALERSKACSRARVGGESGGVDDCPRNLVERGRHQHWRGRVEIVISAPKGDFSSLRKRWKMWWKNAATVQPPFFLSTFKDFKRYQRRMYMIRIATM